MPAITITVTNAEAARVTAWALANGHADGKAGAIALVAGAVKGWEMQQQLVASANAVQAAYAPIAPT